MARITGRRPDAPAPLSAGSSPPNSHPPESQLPMDLTRGADADTGQGMELKREPPKEAQAGEGLGGTLPRAHQAESVELGSGVRFVEVDDRGVPLVMTRPKPRGLLPVPPEVEAIIIKEEGRLRTEKDIVPTPEARRRMVDSFTLQYYYEGFDVAHRPTPQGVEVLAVGHEEIGRLVRGMGREELLKIKIGQP